MEPAYQEMGKVLKALSDPKRLRIASLLAKEELGASKLLEFFEVTQPTLSHDMRVLLDAGVVTERRAGKQVFYRLNKENMSAFTLQLQGALEL
ncbi:MAG: winged helix-turn-helix transcriptional regulator [Clostridia bacterium]|nr:winged helix-turn-helix transcriptional regulator [Clostridia bacterium]